MARGLRYIGACTLFALTLSTVHANPKAADPVYMEEGDGETSLWVDVAGAGFWFTDRAPLADFSPLILGLGVAHRIGPARLGSRVHLFLAPGADRKLTFIYADLLAVERVLAYGTWRPFWRLALGVGLDLKGTQRALGDDGYFNAENGPSAGIGLTHGWGVEALVTEAMFLRLEADIRAYGGAGRSGIMTSAHLGVGWIF